MNFTVKNFRSFKFCRTLSMEASSITEHRSSVKVLNRYKILPLAIIYGANSSGKSNLIKALMLMNTMVHNSVKLNDTDSLPFTPYALDEISTKQPTLFEIQFIKNDTRFRYGFEYDSKKIISEWLYEKCKGEKEYNLFVRSQGLIEVSENRFKEGKEKEEMTNPNRLFLSLVAQLKGEKSRLIMNWFGNCNVLSGLTGEGYAGFSLGMFCDGLKGVNEASAFFKKVQLGFNHFEVRRTELPEDVLDRIPAEVKERIKGGKVVDTITSHSVFDEFGNVIGERMFDEDEMESEGTKKVIELSGPIFDTLSEGKVLVVDELDAKLHPLLTRNIVLLFMNPETNKNNAQLIFATHDTNLLDLKLIRRDQIWFTEKDAFDSTDVYSLVEFKDENGNKVRNDRNIEKDYITGRYGAIPFIGRMN